MNYDTMSQNRKHWGKKEQAQLAKSTIPVILDWIPRDVKTILNFGCGNETITNALVERFDVTCTDFSESALKFVKGKKVLASVDKLPFEDNSFDLVLSIAMLEHIPDSILRDAMEEIKRVTKGYVFLAVPNSEYLKQGYTKCPKCETTFHVYGHLRSFKLQTLDDMMGPSYKRYMMGTFNPKEKKYNHFLLMLRQKAANKWFQATENTICPQCGNNEFSKHGGNILSVLIDGLNWMISGRQKYWLFAFYEIKDMI